MIRTAIVFVVVVACTASPSPLDPLLKADAQTAAPQPSTQRIAIVSTLDGVPQYGWEQAFGGPADKYLGCMRSTGAGSFELGPRLDVGDRLLSFTAEVAGNATADLTIVARRRTVDPIAGTATIDDIGSVSVSDLPPSTGDVAVDVADTLATANASIWLEFSANAAGLCVGVVRLTYQPAP